MFQFDFTFAMLNFVIIILIFAAVFNIEFANCEIFSAIDELEKLAYDEKIIIEEFQVFASDLNDDYVDRLAGVYRSFDMIVFFFHIHYTKI